MKQNKTTTTTKISQNEVEVVLAKLTWNKIIPDFKLI